jgi:hypothetical protein
MVPIFFFVDSSKKQGKHTTSRLHRDYIETTSRLHRDYNETTSRLHRDYNETTPRLHRDYNETTSRLHRDKKYRDKISLLAHTISPTNH